MPTQILQVKNKGLYTAPNEFGVPQGALKKANNCVINDQDILESRRGVESFFNLPDAADRADRYVFYKTKQIVAYSNGKIGHFDGVSTFTAYAGTFSDPSATEAKRRFIKSANNLFVTTSAGVFRTDAVATAPTLSGMFKALDITGTLTGVTGFFEADNQIAYRVVWGIKDANNNLIIGAPSGREVLINPLAAGIDHDVSLVVTIPSGITTSHFIQVYRSRASGGESIEPSDEMGLVYENNPTAGEITAGTMTIPDSTPDDLTGATLYTSPSQQGILQANDRPPLAWDIAEFQDSMAYANTQSKHRKIFTILSASAIAYNDTITIDGDVYTARGTENIASLHYSLSKTFTFTANTTNTSTTITNISSTIGLKVGRTITGAGIPASTTIVSFDAGAATAVISNAATATAAGVTITQAVSALPSQNIEDTARSLIRVINRNTTNNSVYAYYLSGENDLPGKILIEERGLGGASFAITASANGTAFNPVLPTSGTTVSSENDDFQNQIAFSKTGQPEAVPLLNTRNVGSLNDPILRVVPLRSSLFVFKKEEGIFRVTGTSPADFKVELFDSSARLLAPDSLAITNNQIWCLTDQGVVRISETAVSIVSRPIEDLVLAQLGESLSGVRQYSWAMGYETERKYILFTISDSADTVATQAFVFNTITESFTIWPISKAAGLVNPENDIAYFGDGDSQVQEKERKTRTYTDFIDRGSSYTVTSSTGTTVFMASTSGIEAGDLLYESASKWSVILEVQAAFVVTAFTVAWTPGSLTVFKAIPCLVEWAPIVGDNPGALKQFQETTLLFDEATFPVAKARFATDLVPGFQEVDVAGSTEGSWGLFQWGVQLWGGVPFPAPRRVDVPRETQRGCLLRVGFSHRNGFGTFKLNGFSVPIRMTESTKI